jgi:hypothetical protein
LFEQAATDAFTASAVVDAAAVATAWATAESSTSSDAFRFGTTAFVHLEAAGICKRTREVSELFEKQQCSKSDNSAEYISVPFFIR